MEGEGGGNARIMDYFFFAFHYMCGGRRRRDCITIVFPLSPRRASLLVHCPTSSSVTAERVSGTRRSESAIVQAAPFAEVTTKVPFEIEDDHC